MEILLCDIYIEENINNKWQIKNDTVFIMMR